MWGGRSSKQDMWGQRCWLSPVPFHFPPILFQDRARIEVQGLVEGARRAPAHVPKVCVFRGGGAGGVGRGFCLAPTLIHALEGERGGEDDRVWGG